MRGDKTEKSKWAICGMIVGAIAVGIGIVNPYSIINPDVSAFGLVILFVSLFAFLICAFYYSDDKGLDKGEIRRSITITFIVMYVAFLCLSLAPSNAVLDFKGDNTFINNFHNAILVILAFYFGSRAFEVGMGARTKIRDWAKIFKIEKVENMTTGELKEKMKDKIKGKNAEELKKLIEDMIERE